ncbi:phosphoribosylformimino-5-aminoimidazole carboxamide ribotide isomerase [Caldicellulosiruptor saccharolyticus DSM 8903]|uniref:1-(5-phosphoribosyl)-5-[(5-phosphoribosylamino)methylideneamino] imidazole-4-carboxamide isomerase n=1 Tax=Caldicellulosiruptor saccharolyticus (strain ATCC 43494 / DSM 8903 / Tp8T 6331) TaxID=351627 RepID=HIS4_CALS8|nr:1-(5-phosphoribosyl)-5-[(5-phosphoribosylamino)methylideneamino]imidazole-4-carboxamide isomerase [Caldicellulosiruptor saccharolyticus]A4XL21.1 RecName: Full=1-(5-phosphoribosyl)-5-[(5-phosphoribosylamino)methylideneamino] imidazole-4-carboxamide isomerase; AltName: Full=Phosphoribosylformimino-5-aminoimidazole carboxamide ribotide isomerase [Caldicellulosiruptor saccharolyticus DSM 8903]ABP67606.1 phosphoribosylformimino-5-aminoimidazole carboxamide ribotide isomerase [Caldicellulosiruptor s
MIVIPAIDIIDGKCVRLTQGDYSRVQEYNLDPVQQAKYFEKEGARYLHVVDLDGAKKGSPVNFEVIKRIKESTSLSVECGGGIRDKKTINDYLLAGIDYIILGSVIFKNPEFVEDVLKRFGNERFIASLDFEEGYVKLSGWQEATRISVEEGILHIKKLGFQKLIYTDIKTDGMLKGHNFEAAKYIRSLFDGFLISSGGISSMNDVLKLKDIGVDGVIIGKALYTGHVKLNEIINLV